MSVREGDPADLARLREIQSTLAEPWPELLETATEGPPPLLVVETERPVGYAVLIVDGDSVAYLPEFVVHPDHRREGYGSRLMTAVVNRLAAEGYERLRLTVRPDDEPARRFYAAHGFETLDRLAGHYETGDGLLLERSLG